MRTFIKSLLGLAIILTSVSVIHGYACPDGYYCNTDGGTGTTAYYRTSGTHKDFETGRTVPNCGYGPVPYSCTGSASSCYGGGRTIFSSFHDCEMGANGYTDNWYCCDKNAAPPCTSNGSCSCTPSCDTGYTSSNNGCAITKTKTCSGTDNCNNSCTSAPITCYFIETNLSFVQSNGSTSGPSSVSMIVDGTTYSLSTDPSNPTHIKLPASGSSNVQVSVPTFTAPTTSRGANYYFQANNYGVNDEWKTWTTCSGVDGEDFCTTMPNSNNTQSFTPASKTVNQVLKEGTTGQISAKYATTDKCADTYKYSVAIEGYYVVDTIPDTPIPPDDDEDGSIFDLTTDITTTKGCTTTTYTGLEANNPLHVVATTTDTNSNDEIQAFTLWFSKDDTVPTTGTITGTYSGSSNQDLGIMIRKNGSDWSNPYIYATNTSPFTFAQLTGGYITVNGSNVARIYDLSVTQDTSITFDYKIEFLASTEALSGMYNVYGGSLDSYMINGTSIDQSYFTSLTDWGIDLVNPVVNDITQQVNDPTSTYITWSVADTISGIDRTVMNAYRVGGLVTDDATLYIPVTYTTSKGSISLGALPAEESIGTYTGTNAWVFTTSNGEQDLLDIGNNESGNILVYTTPYDMACNTDSGSENIDLNPWFASRGGSVFSTNNISSSPKDVSTTTNLDDVFNLKTAMVKERVDLGTELLSTRSVNISNLIHPASGAVRTLSTYDSNNMKNYWYQTLFDAFQKRIQNLSAMSDVTTSSTLDCNGDNCYYYPAQEDTGIYIPANYICDKPTLFISEQNIYIEPNIESGSNFSGCIFLTKNNIYIGAGEYLSDTKIKYDYMEGFFIADNQIIFSLADQAETLRDGVEVYGSLVALGSNISNGTSAISIERNMKLFNQTNPTLVVTYDNKYNGLSRIFFGTFADLYKQEVGFKSY